jgi:hypothetical protein
MFTYVYIILFLGYIILVYEFEQIFYEVCC